MINLMVMVHHMYLHIQWHVEEDSFHENSDIGSKAHHISMLQEELSKLTPVNVDEYDAGVKLLHKAMELYVPGNNVDVVIKMLNTSEDKIISSVRE